MTRRDMILDSMKELALSRADMMLQLHDFNKVDNRAGVAYCEDQLRWIGDALRTLANELATLPCPEHNIRRNRYFNEDIGDVPEIENSEGE